MKNATLSLVLPMQHTTNNLAAIVQECLMVVPHYFIDYEIILVDDGKRDDITTIAYDQALRHDPVMVVRLRQSPENARSVVSGLNNARGDYILIFHPEDQMSIHELGRMLPYIDHHDLMTGYRIQQQRAPGGRLHTLFHGLANRLLATDLHDIGCRFSIMRAEWTEPLELIAPDSLVHVELYARARRQGARHVQVGLYEQVAQDSQTSQADSRITLSLFLGIVRLWLRLPRGASGKTPRQRLRAFWQPRMLWGVGGVGLLAILTRSTWLLLRRREN